MQTVYLNGEYTDKDQANISIMDRGFLFGDGVYEVIPYFQGQSLGALPHLDRLNNSLQSIYIQPPLTHEQWGEIFADLIQRNQLAGKTFSIYLQITRGPHPSRHHAIPKTCQPTVLAFCLPENPIDNQSGQHAITLPDSRHDFCEIKSTNLLANILAFEQAKQRGAIEAILYRDDHITEGTCSNVFVIKQGIIKTPPLKPTMLKGITRTLILQLANTRHIQCNESPITVSELLQADEIWVSSSTKQICSITRLNDQKVGNGEIGPVWHQINTLYNQYKDQRDDGGKSHDN